MTDLHTPPPLEDYDDLIAIADYIDTSSGEKEPEKPPHNWRVKTLADVDENRNPTRYVIDPILPEASLNIWYGASGSKKSLIAKEAAFTILSDGNFIPGSMPEMPTKSRPVLWLDMDNGNDVMDERIAAFRRTRSICNDAPFYYVSMPQPWPFIAEINSQADLRLLVEDLKIGVLIIDNLGTISGDIDENSAQMVRIMAPLRELADKTRAAIILIHHERKGGANGGRSGEALRGHTVIEAALDYAISITNDEDSDIVTMKCTKARRFRFDDIKAKFNYTHLPLSKDLETIWFCAPAWARGTNEVKDAIWAVLDAASSGRITQGRLIDSVYDLLEHKASKPKIRGWLDEMVEINQVINVEKGEKNAKIYSLKP